MQNDDACMAVVTLYNFVRLCITYIDWYPFELGLQRNWMFFFIFFIYTYCIYHAVQKSGNFIKTPAVFLVGCLQFCEVDILTLLLYYYCLKHIELFSLGCIVFLSEILCMGAP